MEDRREINLFEFIMMIWRKIKHSVWFIFSLCKRSLVLSFKYFWLVYPLVLVMLIAGYLLTTKENTTYEANGIAVLASENRTHIMNDIQALNSLKSDEKDFVKEKMSLSDEELKQLIEIRSFFVIDCLNDSTADMVAFKISNKLLQDTVNTVVPDMLSIQFVMKGTTNYRPYLKGLEQYFNSNNNLRLRDSVSKEMTKEKIAFCNRELDRLDRFSEYDYFGGGNKSLQLNHKGIRLEPSREYLYYQNMRDLLHEKEYLTSSLASKKGVLTFVSPHMSIATSPRYIKLFLFALLGFVIGVSIASWLQRRKKSQDKQI